MPSQAVGRVHELHRKPETAGEVGLPKPTVLAVRVTRQGVEGDFNRFRHEKRKDDPGQALLLMALETLEELQTEGWPVRSGDLGENITTSGLPYSELLPGRRFRVGSVALEIVKACAPCKNLFTLPYVGEARGPEFVRLMKGRRGWYARVLREGRIRKGDTVHLLAPTANG